MFVHVVLKEDLREDWTCPTEPPLKIKLLLLLLLFCICVNKGPDQLGGKLAADQRCCFCYKDSAIPLPFKHVISSPSHLLWLYSLVFVRPGRKFLRQVFL